MDYVKTALCASVEIEKEDGRISAECAKKLLVGKILCINKVYVDYPGCKRLSVTQSDGKDLYVKIAEETRIEVYFYNLHPYAEFLQKMPCSLYVNLWEELYFEQELKQRMLTYLELLQKERKEKNSEFYSVLSGFLLFYGPPGTGKSSLALALSQKLAVRGNRECYLLKVNSSEIYNKHFGESVQNLKSVFRQAAEIEKNGGVVFLLFDEIDSFCTKRSHLYETKDVSETIRIVNEFIVQLDSTRRSSIYLFGTSNSLEQLDDAVTDRADLCIKVKSEGHRLYYAIFKGVYKFFSDNKGVEDETLPEYDLLVNEKELHRELQGLFLRCFRHGYSPRRLKKILLYAVMSTLTRMTPVDLVKRTNLLVEEES